MATTRSSSTPVAASRRVDLPTTKEKHGGRWGEKRRPEQQGVHVRVRPTGGGRILLHFLHGRRPMGKPARNQREMPEDDAVALRNSPRAGSRKKRGGKPPHNTPSSEVSSAGRRPDRPTADQPPVASAFATTPGLLILFLPDSPLRRWTFRNVVFSGRTSGSELITLEEEEATSPPVTLTAAAPSSAASSAGASSAAAVSTDH